MSPKTLFATAAAITASAVVLLGSGIAHADPAPLPIDGAQAPGLSAIQSLSPVIQQAAADPAGAAQLLMAAAQAFAANKSAPDDSRNVATAVNHFVAEPAAAAPAAAAPAAHVPGAGAGPEAHLPTGIDPANAVGPAPAAPLEAPAPAPEAA
ncbi:hypothetical protein H7J55_13990, partial [Mycolicibacterium brisbanense]|nr:hypothetical protein [Mycolicibacterium brisbanense]